jgi:hypothetical protein|tara:strand:- start:266 stop:460 length:195 start_codon:yes stop_codon:yes gene_type:complete
MNNRPFDMVRYANSLLSGWPEVDAGRPEEGDERIAIEKKTIKMKCVYPDPDDGASYSWIKVTGE